MKIFKIGFSNYTEDYEQYNAITKQLKEDQLKYYQRLYESEDVIEE
ncbi:hypothetical protein [Viridibacillus arvi]|nr:hypothetical protein [Viridibacillus sp. JNUCC-6]QOV13202.1 hypothetical protein JNUCC6_10915 [Viridibacillus sp. JNUCC-6]